MIRALAYSISMVFVALLALGPMPASAQFGVLDRTRAAMEEAKKAQEALRQAEEARKKEQAGTPPATASTPTAATATATEPAASAPSFQAFSKFDFVPGEKVVAFEDFSQDSIGDFPAKWNTDASGEIVTVAGKPGRWLKLTRGGAFVPELSPTLPDNFTLEFDLLVSPAFKSGHLLNASIVELSDVRQIVSWQTASNRFTFTVSPGGQMWNSSWVARLDAHSQTGTTIGGVTGVTQSPWKGDPLHVAVTRQGPRVRVYLNQEKMWDVPRPLVPTAKYNLIVFFVPNVDPGSEYFVSNVRLAVGAPDTRNKLLTQGKWVTNGILFDVNSDRIKGESYGTLKEIAGVLTENADLKVQIVGHTDSDGDTAANLDLSRRRAASVKTALVTEFKIDAGRMDTDGKGENEPADTGTTSAAKAANRRVEFITKK
jgi:outer membrane protein OmpA-like peptidoglycan-associated protein